MSWICDLCSTNNEDDTSVCFVCGTPRSKESYAASRIRKRERIYNMVGDFLVRKVYLGLLIALLCLILIFFVGSLIGILTGGVLDHFFEGAQSLFNKISSNFMNSIPVLENNFSGIGQRIVGNLQLQPFFSELFDRGRGAFELFMGRIRLLADFSDKTNLFVVLWNNVVENVKLMIDVLQELAVRVG